MLTITSLADPAAVRTVQFANDVLEASGAAFYRVNSDMTLDNFVLLGVPPEFHRQYVAEMNRHDPLHVRHMVPTGRPVARLVDEMASAQAIDATERSQPCVSARVSPVWRLRRWMTTRSDS